MCKSYRWQHPLIRICVRQNVLLDIWGFAIYWVEIWTIYLFVALEIMWELIVVEEQGRYLSSLAKLTLPINWSFCGKMWSICIIPLVIIIAMTYCSHKWRNPTSKGIRLPPGSMGLPFIGETIQFFIPSKSLDLHSFLKSRINKYACVCARAPYTNSLISYISVYVNWTLVI